MPPPRLLQQVPADTRREAMEIARLRMRARKQYRERMANRPVPNIVDWAQKYYYITETRKPVRLSLFQIAILRYIFRKDETTGRLPFTTVVWSQPKKSGKTAIAGLVGRYYAETQAAFGEIFCLANDFEQAAGRIYKAAKESIELDPDYNRDRRTLRGEWVVRDRSMTHLPSGSVVSASASEYKSEAGSNPSITLWSELWGFTSEASRRLWDEMTPVPTRQNSMRWVETYAGFEGESDLLNDLMDSGLKPENGGRQMTAGELGQVDGQWPFAETTGPDDPIPCYVNPDSRLFMFYDTGEQAHRQPWQQGEIGDDYYREQKRTASNPNTYNRLHLNHRVSAESALLPIEWWDSCQVPELRPLGSDPVVIALDAGVTSDTFAIVAVSRHPDDRTKLALRGAWKIVPPPGGSVDFEKVREGLKARKEQDHWNIAQVCYDPYQLHEPAKRWAKELGLWFYRFEQGMPRLIADKALVDLIRDKRIAHLGHPDLREHLTNANAKLNKDEDNRLRIVKKGKNSKVDLAVALSMACHEALRIAI